MDAPLGQQPESSPPPAGKQPTKRWLIALVSVAVLAGFYWVGTNDTLVNESSGEAESSLPTLSDDSPVETQDTNADSSPSVDSQTANAPTKTVDSSGAFKLTGKSASNCTAQAPADWNMESNAESNSADLFGPGKQLYAGYGIQAVNTGLAQFAGAYQAPLNDPDLYSEDPATVTKAYARIIVSSLGGTSNVEYTSDYDETIGDYTLRSIATSTHKGVIFFHTEGFPGDNINYSYAEPMYFAFTTNDRWENQGLLVAQIAAGIQCSVQLVVHTGPVVEAQTSSGASNTDTNGSDDGYNPQLGTEYVHDASTGENYLVSPSESWSANGPDGDGYYKQNGADYTKLAPGRSD